MIKKLLSRLFDYHPNSISFKQGMDLTELPIVTFYQGENRFNFLLDTGANNSIIDSNILPQIEHRKVDQETTVYGLEGQKVVVPLCQITLSHKDQNYDYVWLIKDMKEPFGHIKEESGVILHGIIGSNFFNKFRYVLDFAELIAYSKK